MHDFSMKEPTVGTNADNQDAIAESTDWKLSAVLKNIATTYHLQTNK